MSLTIFSSILIRVRADVGTKRLVRVMQGSDIMILTRRRSECETACSRTGPSPARSAALLSAARARSERDPDRAQRREHGQAKPRIHLKGSTKSWGSVLRGLARTVDCGRSCWTHRWSEFVSVLAGQSDQFFGSIRNGRKAHATRRVCGIKSRHLRSART